MRIKNLNRVIVALSGGIASAWCGEWALREFPKDKVILYFNDTKWEHKDLYRFLKDLEKFWKHEITYDSDGRSVEDVFFDSNAIANDRMPFCSRILKAERLQKFYEHNDLIIFGIGIKEKHRAERIINVYKNVSETTGKNVFLRFPLIQNKVTEQEMKSWLKSINIEMPELYKLGFKHNNCSGGCVRATIKQWIHLYKVLPEIYSQREQAEENVREYLSKDVSILAEGTLKSIRERLERGYNFPLFPEDDKPVECIGACSKEN